MEQVFRAVCGCEFTEHRAAANHEVWILKMIQEELDQHKEATSQGDNEDDQAYKARVEQMETSMAIRRVNAIKRLVTGEKCEENAQ